jgi:hypothetical protein
MDLGRAVLDALKDRTFVIVCVILLVSAMGIQTTAKKMKLHFRKLPIPLVKDLQEFDSGKMWPYKLVKKEQISSEVVGELGTKDYLQARYEDTTVGESDPGRNINLFVTYYTGNPDQVPHVPDVCYLGGGYDPEGAYLDTVKVPGSGQPDDKVPIRILHFKNNKGITPIYHTVVYFFSVNGKYAEERMKVRWYLGDIRLKYAYFSKVEISFLSLSKLDKESVVRVSEKFFRKALPILVHDHWQDWNTFTKQ